MSDMAIFQVKNREFQRSSADWLRKARQGDTVVIVSSEGPPLTLTAGRPKRGAVPDWKGHLEWLKKQPIVETNPVDELRKNDRR
jgi:antitoxin (DNA-binding transcriptional repressor) of toxin-antitoxin stability system